MILSFGRFAFETGYDRMLPISDAKRSLGLEKEDQDQESGKPATLIKGSKLEEFSFKVKLLRVFDPRPESAISQLETVINKKKPEKLVLGGRVVGKYKWLLVKMEIDYQLLNGDGRILEAGISLSFEEFVKAGTKKAETQTTAKSSAPGVSSIKANDAYKTADATSEDRANKKRTLDEKRLSKM